MGVKLISCYLKFINIAKMHGLMKIKMLSIFLCLFFFPPNDVEKNIYHVLRKIGI